MKGQRVYRIMIVALMVSTLTCSLVMIVFLQRFFYGDLKVEDPATLHRLVGSIDVSGNLGYNDYRDVLESTDVFDGLAAAFRQSGQAVYAGEHPLWLNIAWATGNFGRTIRGPIMEEGRFFTEVDDDPGASKVAVVSRSTWETLRPGQAFDAGVALYVKGTPFEVIGVCDGAFPWLDSLEGINVWIPAKQNPDTWQYQFDDFQAYQVIARLDPRLRAIAEQQTDMALEDLVDRLGYVYTADVMSETEFRIHRKPAMYRLFLALLVVSGVLFALGLVNQLLMLVTRSLVINADLKVMVALGARGKHVLLRFLSGFATLVGVSLLGVLLCSFAVIHLYNAFWGTDFGAIDAGQLLDPLALLALSGLTLVLVALHLVFPLGMYLFRGDNFFSRDRTGGARFSVNNALSVAGVVLQVALVTVTILGCGAFLSSLDNVGSVEASRYEKRMAYVEIAFASKEAQFPYIYRNRFERIVASLLDLGGIESVSTSERLPLEKTAWTIPLIEGRLPDPEPDRVGFDFIGAGYFDTVGISLTGGSEFLPEDCGVWPHQKFIVNEAFAKKYFPGQIAIGRNIAPWDGAEYKPIVGIVEDEPVLTDGTITPMMYIPFYRNRLVLNIRYSHASLVKTQLETTLDRIRETDPDVIVVSVNTIDTIWEKALKSPRLGFYVLLGLSLVGLALAVCGVYGYQAYMMLLGARDFAVRHALGQTAEGIFWSEVRRGLVLALVGLAVGVAAFPVGARIFGARFFDIQPAIAPTIAICVVLAMCFGLIVAVASLGSRKPSLAILMRD